jgi:enoyl-CoA hydratase/carnithine racemase
MNGAKWAALTCIQVKRHAGIVEVRLNRPKKMNAINSVMENEFYSVLADCERMDDVKCVLLTAEGPNFSSGHDVQQVAAETIGGLEPATIDDKYWVHTGDLLPPWRFSKGLVVATKGYVGPHANTFVLAADIVIAADDTRFSWEESRVGVGTPYGPYALMPFHFPIRVMKQLWMTGGWMDAQTARQLFYVNRVVPLGQEEQTAMRFAEQIARMETGDLAANKRGTHRLYEAAGLSAMVDVGRDPYVPAGDAAVAKENHLRLIYEKGVSAAVRERDTGWDGEVSRV